MIFIIKIIILDDIVLIVDMKKSLLWSIEGGKIRCNLCARLCLIPNGIKGFCQTRKNIDGVLYATMYGEISMSGVDPIEKKPFFHFHPGSKSFSISTVGCTFRCKFCQNYDISQKQFKMNKQKPIDIVKKANELKCKSISYTYNEPTVFFEYALDTAKEASKIGILNTFVTNGYLTSEAIDVASKYIQAITIGVKGSLNKKFYEKIMSVSDPDSVKQTILELKRKKIHIEITDLLVSKFGDDLNDVKKFTKWIYNNIGPDTPLHFTKFHPDWKLNDIPSTSVNVIEEAYSIAKEEGLNYVYAGNMPGHPLENTYCPKCNEVLIKRDSFNIKILNINRKLCNKCGTKISYIC
jgi:pyruvate formate lyase activating enzyme